MRNLFDETFLVSWMMEMRILTLECNEFSFACKQRLEFADPVTADENRSGSWDHCLLLLISIETADASKINRAVKAIRRIARNVGTQQLVFNAFAHLSEDLADPEVSSRLLAELVAKMADSGDWEVSSTPFGWHKELNMAVAVGPWSQKFIHL
ncbi:threonyl-tRNA synthetase editing domain-containing protein [Fodinicola acaciae]|uniref:threonyl-tRNA synthetase editing domain-containing protein n=1 Tax=Fodinicola acaciae TaxID=2681555 RepID=UPI003CCC97A5